MIRSGTFHPGASRRRMFLTMLAGLTSVVLIGTAGPVVAASGSLSSDRGSGTIISHLPAAPNIAGGARHTLMTGPQDLPAATGSNSAGQLGDTTEFSHATTLPMKGLPPAVTAVALTGGERHSVVIGSDGVAYATGSNEYGQLGDYYSNTHSRATLAPMLGLPTGVSATRSVATGMSHTLLVGSDGVPYATGRNDYGQIGDDSHIYRGRLTPMLGLPDGVTATAVAAGSSSNFSLVLGSDGVVYGTGDNRQGQLGDDTRTEHNTLTPMTMPDDVSATAIAAGESFSLVLGSDDNVYATGSNQWGQFGDGSNTSQLTLERMIMLEGLTPTAIAAGGKHSLVLGSDHVVYGAGYNADGELGDGTTRSDQILSPMVMPDGITATSVTAGDRHSLIRGSDGLVYGTGHNGNGQLTDSATDDQLTLVPLAGQMWSNTDPTIQGKARFGDTLRVVEGEWSYQPTSYDYQWLRGRDPIPNATGSEFTPRRGDIGKPVSIRVTAHHAGLEPATFTTKAVTIKKGVAPKYTAKKPSLKGKAKVGKKLRLKGFKTSAFSPKPTSTKIQWLRNGKVIRHATKKAYRITRADRGKKIQVRITAKLKGHNPGTVKTKKIRVRR